MAAEGAAIDLDPSYVAGLFDAIGRVRFDISETEGETYTVRPMLRLRPHQVQLRAAVVGEFLEDRGYQYDFIERDYGEQFFRVQQRSDLEALQSFLEGRSAHLVRELEFVTSVFADEFDFEILDPSELHRFLVARDRLRYGWRPRGRFHVSPDEIVERHGLDPDADRSLTLPTGTFRDDYTVEWIAGVYDGLCRYRPSIAESDDYEIGYAMHPIARLHRAGVSSTLVESVVQFCDDYNLSYGNSSESNTLNLTFTGAANVRRVLDVLFSRLLVLAEASEELVGSVLPRFDQNRHHERQGFYDLLRDFDRVADASGGPFRQREYDPEFFASEWDEVLDRPQSEPGTVETAPTRTADLHDVTLSVDAFEDVPGRYRSVVDRAECDPASAAALKSLYGDRCQLCGARLASGDGTGYSEVHYLRPLSDPHDGADAPENMLVLCPNHHADFDNGVVRVTVADRSVDHPYDSAVDGDRLTVDPDHDVSDAALRYHNRRRCRLW